LQRFGVAFPAQPFAILDASAGAVGRNRFINQAGREKLATGNMGKMTGMTVKLVAARTSAETTPAATTENAPLAVEIDNVAVRFTTDRGTITALSDVSVKVPQGGFMSLLGPSGCGKSTLLRLAADIVKPTSGTVQVLGAAPNVARARRDIGFVFQDAGLLPWRTVLENVTLPFEVGGGVPKGRGSDPKAMLELVGLGGWMNAYPRELSGGMRQRVSIARALVSGPKLLFMDEPFGALDEITRDRLNEELLGIWERTGTTILFVTHSIYEAAFLGQEVLLLASRPGRVREKVTVTLPSPRKIELRETQQFVELVTHLRQVLETC
jgi:NitT/TauT family transport system ATP-binding protein